MAKVILAFARHAEYEQLAATPSAHQPFALNEQGISQARQQAQLFTELLQQKGWQLLPHIASSNMLRAWQTADIFKQSLQASITEEITIDCFDGLAERSVGSVANLSVEQIEQIIDSDPRYDVLPENWKSDSHFCLPFQGAESLLDAGKRVAECLQKQLEQINETEIPQVKLVIGHGASFRHAAYHLGILEFEMIAKLSMYHAQPLLFEFDQGRWQHIAGDWKQRQPKREAID
jgi:2,3-bisphosphoglycerate-dependent phosphoglycerate mutase